MFPNNFLVVMSAIIFSAVRQVESALKTGTYKRPGNTLYTISPLNVTYTTSSGLTCSVRCMEQSNRCSCYSYNSSTNLCTLGSWVIPKQAPYLPADGVIFSNGKYCDLTLGYKIVTNVNTTACIFISTATATFVNARAVCTGKRGFHFSGKTRNELRIFLDSAKGFAESVWYGLSDLVTYKVFLFEDDQSVLNDTMYPIFFNPGEPNGSGSDCIMLFPKNAGLIDNSCGGVARYICQYNSQMPL